MDPSPPLDSFGSRVSAAIHHLSPARQRALSQQYPEARGVHEAIALACEIPHLSILSDIAADRRPGHKYRQRLAQILGVSLAWLEGSGGREPDWALSPVAAWRRFAASLRQASDVIDEDDSASPNTERRRAPPSTLVLAHGLAIDEQQAAALAAARYTEVPFATVLAYARSLGLPRPTHPEHLEEGHALWVHLAAELARELHIARRSFFRYIPPPQLFAVIREALVKPSGGADATARADALEVLWRQQWLLAGRSRSSLPETFAQDTGHPHWRTLNQIRETWLDTDAARHATRASPTHGGRRERTTGQL